MYMFLWGVGVVLERLGSKKLDKTQTLKAASAESVLPPQRPWRCAQLPGVLAPLYMHIDIDVDIDIDINFFPSQWGNFQLSLFPCLTLMNKQGLSFLVLDVWKTEWLGKWC